MLGPYAIMHVFAVKSEKRGKFTKAQKYEKNLDLIVRERLPKIMLFMEPRNHRKEQFFC